jgi:hypothetical protein
MSAVEGDVEKLVQLVALTLGEREREVGLIGHPRLGELALLRLYLGALAFLDGCEGMEADNVRHSPAPGYRLSHGPGEPIVGVDEVVPLPFRLHESQQVVAVLAEVRDNFGLDGARGHRRAGE